LRLLYVACGDKDGLFRVSENVHKMLDEKKVPLHLLRPGEFPGLEHWRALTVLKVPV